MSLFGMSAECGAGLSVLWRYASHIRKFVSGSGRRHVGGEAHETGGRVYIGVRHLGIARPSRCADTTNGPR